MGAIVSNFPQLPTDSHPHRSVLYAAIYSDLTSLGLPLPTAPADTITRVELLHHLRMMAGACIAAEIATDEEQRYDSLTDAQIAVVIGSEFAPNVPSRWPGSAATGYIVTASTTSGLTATIVDGTVAGFDTLLRNSETGTLQGAAYLRFRNTTPTVALRGKHGRIDDAPSANALTFATPAPAVPPIGNVFDIGYLRPSRLPPRLGYIFRRLPHAPNVLTAADIAAARI